MTFRRIVPQLLVTCFALSLTASVAAQSGETDSRQTSIAVDGNGSKRLETNLSAPVPIEDSRSRTMAAPARFEQLLLSAIQSHLGATYRFNRTGPGSFDCSGFVWRAFQDVGLNFTRGPARSYWATFAAPPKGEQFKFGTLVFFSGLTHVGIVADEKGFYHSSRHHGVVYSPFNDYWLSRIDGFRRVPPELMQPPDANVKQPTAKPTSTTTTVENEEP